jgi:hypothetical protein
MHIGTLLVGLFTTLGTVFIVKAIGESFSAGSLTGFITSFALLVSIYCNLKPNG